MIEKNIENRQQEFERFFILYFPKVKNFAYALLKSHEEAEDLAQDIFVQLWEHPELWRDKDVQGYLYTITKNRVLNRIKHRCVERNYEKEIASTAWIREMLENPLDDIYYKEIILILKLTLEQMPERRRQVFQMSRLEEMSNEEIAQKLDLSVRTVEHHIYLALAELKKVLIATLFFFSL